MAWGCPCSPTAPPRPETMPTSQHWRRSRPSTARRARSRPTARYAAATEWSGTGSWKFCPQNQRMPACIRISVHNSRSLRSYNTPSDITKSSLRVDAWRLLLAEYHPATASGTSSNPAPRRFSEAHDGLAPSSPCPPSGRAQACKNLGSTSAAPAPEERRLIAPSTYFPPP